MPGGVAHRIEAHGPVAMRTLYIDASVSAGLPHEVCVLQVSPLLRELVLAAVAAGPEYAPGSAEDRATQVILDQIERLPVAPLALPLPRDPRLLEVARELLGDPADERTVSQWAAEIGMSERTFSRRFRAETRLSFRAWRLQRRLLRALECLASGVSVTGTAAELGYESTSAFIAMFRRSLGAPPSRYLARGRRTSREGREVVERARPAAR
jgi:AraC-like DNA-binding protein